MTWLQPLRLEQKKSAEAEAVANMAEKREQEKKELDLADIEVPHTRMRHYTQSYN
jgi:hypothetical protein